MSDAPVARAFFSAICALPMLLVVSAVLLADRKKAFLTQALSAAAVGAATAMPAKVLAEDSYRFGLMDAAFRQFGIPLFAGAAVFGSFAVNIRSAIAALLCAIGVPLGGVLVWMMYAGGQSRGGDAGMGVAFAVALMLSQLPWAVAGWAGARSRMQKARAKRPRA